MRLLFVLLFFAFAGCSKPPAVAVKKPNPFDKFDTDSYLAEPSALEPRYVFIARGRPGDISLYRCNTYTGKIEIVIFSPEKNEWIVRTIATGDAREEVSLLPALNSAK